MPRSRARVLGPYRNGDKWRLVVLEGAARKSLVVETEERALTLRGELQQALKAQTSRLMAEAFEEYGQHLRERDMRPETIAVYEKILRTFLPLDEPLSALTPERARAMYEAETRRARPDGRPIAVDTHHKLLKTARLFFGWAVSRRYLDKNPFAEVKAIGRPRRGKAQLRIDEARRFVAHALEAARGLDVAATAALLQIFLGLRPTEAVIRVVRDLDDSGRVLWVPFGKTANARRRLQVPEVLRDLLLRHVEGKPVEAPLLGRPGEPLHTRQILNKRLPELCAAAGVPRVVPHSLRGLNATLALDAGATAQHVAAALGHASFSTTARHYADASTVANVSLRRVADVLTTVERPSPAQLAALLREHLPQSDLTELARLLTPESTGPR